MRQRISVTFAYAPSTSRAASRVGIKCHRISVRKLLIIRFMAFYKMIRYKSFSDYKTLLLVTRKIPILIHGLLLKVASMSIKTPWLKILMKEPLSRKDKYFAL